MMIFRILLTFLCFTVCTKGHALCDLTKVAEAKRKFFVSCPQCKTVNFLNRIDTHKALVAAYFICPGDLVLDLGAHLGEFSRYYQQLTGDTGYVIAYEASPPIFAALKNRLQQMHNIIVKDRAISNTSGEKLQMKIYPDDVNPQCCSVEKALWNESRMPGNTKIVEVLTEKLDDLLKENIPPIHFIKSDVEGHEHAVFEGATQLLLTCKPVIIFEYGYIKNYFNSGTIQQLEEMGYVCYDLNTDQRVHPDYEVMITDLFGIPKEREQEIIEILPYLH